MLLLYVFYGLPIVMLAVICVAIVGKVREGRYKKEWLGFQPEAPTPSAAIAVVMTPIAFILLWAFAESEIGVRGLAALAVGATVLGYFVFVPAATAI